MASATIHRQRLFDRDRARAKRPGVRSALDFGRWSVERLAGYVITERAPMPSRAAAKREAARIAEEERIDLLPARLPPHARDLPEELQPDSLNRRRMPTAVPHPEGGDRPCP